MFSNQITICQISFEIFDLKQIYSWEKSKYLNSIRVFSFSFFFFIFLLKWNKQEIFNKRRHAKDGKLSGQSHFRQKRPPEVFWKKDVLINFAKFTGKHLCQGLFMSVAKACNFIKQRLWHRSFPVNFAKVLRTPFLQNTSRQLLLCRLNWVSDYYAKSIYIKVFLWIIVLWMLVPSKILRISKYT